MPTSQRNYSSMAKYQMLCTCSMFTGKAIHVLFFCRSRGWERETLTYWQWTERPLYPMTDSTFSARKTRELGLCASGNLNNVYFLLWPLFKANRRLWKAPWLEVKRRPAYLQWFRWLLKDVCKRCTGSQLSRKFFSISEGNEILNRKKSFTVGLQG